MIKPNEYRFSVGRVDGTLGPLRFKSHQEASKWIEDQSEIDPDGIISGDYYFDAPEDFTPSVDCEYPYCACNQRNCC